MANLDEKEFPGLSFEEPIWAKDIGEGDFISHFPSFKSGAGINLFEEFLFFGKECGDIRYYVYDPIKHGADPEGIYPVLFFFHGMGNSMDGKIVINYSMAEFYATQEYQKEMGGAYIVVPVAKERRNENGQVENSWGPKYAETIMDLKRNFCNINEKNVGKSFFFGTSAGGFFVWELLKKYSKEIDVAVPVSGGEIPDEKALDEIRDNGTIILSMHGKHDEFVSFDEAVAPHIEKLKKYANVICYYPEWVRNGDGGIAQLNPWLEMGQHCLCNQVTANLKYDDGRGYDDLLFPNGMTGWIRDHK